MGAVQVSEYASGGGKVLLFGGERYLGKVIPLNRINGQSDRFIFAAFPEHVVSSIKTRFFIILGIFLCTISILAFVVFAMFFKKIIGHP